MCEFSPYSPCFASRRDRILKAHIEQAIQFQWEVMKTPAGLDLPSLVGCSWFRGRATNLQKIMWPLWRDELKNLDGGAVDYFWSPETLMLQDPSSPWKQWVGATPPKFPVWWLSVQPHNSWPLSFQMAFSLHSAIIWVVESTIWSYIMCIIYHGNLD